MFVVCVVCCAGAVPTTMTERRDGQKAEKTLQWFKLMATPAERRKLLLPPDRLGVGEPARAGEPARVDDEGIGERRQQVVANLNNLVVARLKAAFKDAGLKVPHGLTPDPPPTLLLSAIYSHDVDLKKQGITVNPEEFQQWRRGYESRPASPPLGKRKQR
eukprot:9476316-Pyramimonas_sp.AAC.1